jgi:hypothetical protein
MAGENKINTLPEAYQPLAAALEKYDQSQQLP